MALTDYYTYCLKRLVKCNTNNCGGAFYQKQLNDADKETRL